MTRPPFEVANIIRQYGEQSIERHRAWLTAQHRRVLSAVARRRMAALGGHLDRCATCGRCAISFNSCRNRHCPKCLTHGRDQWLAARQNELLPVGYHHVVFTLPRELSRLALHNKKVIYSLLFLASAATLLEVAALAIVVIQGSIRESSVPRGRLTLPARLRRRARSGRDDRRPR